MTRRDEVRPTSGPTPFVTRVWRAAMLDPDLYEEVEADRTALPQAALVVVLGALGFGIGSLTNGGWMGVAWITGAMILGWIGWACIAYWVGAWILPGPETVTDHGELLRTVGFSAAPGCAAVVGLVPGLNPWLLLAVLVWLLAAMVVAIRQALDYRSTARALAVCAIGVPFAVVVLTVVLLFTGPWPL